MGKLFGTDGIRGIVGENLTVELAFHVGQAVAAVLTEEKGSKPTITIGKDTRISSDMLEVIGMSDRVCVFRSGGIVATVEGAAINSENIMTHATTGRVEHVA